MSFTCNFVYHVEQEECLQAVVPTWQTAFPDSTDPKPTKAIFLGSHIHSEVFDNVLIPFVAWHSVRLWKVFIFSCWFTKICALHVTALRCLFCLKQKDESDERSLIIR